MLNRQEEYVKMKFAEGKLWWYKILHEHVLNAIKKNFQSKEIKILDAGCGTGGLMTFLITHGYNEIKGFDFSPYAVEANPLKETHEVLEMDVRKATEQYPQAYFDVIVCNDMLYFIPDSELPTVLSNLYKLLAKGGVMIVNLPAHELFKGMHDISVGIDKRWTFKRFRAVVEKAQLDAQSLTYFYWPLFLSPLIFIARVFQRLAMKKTSNIQSDVNVPPVVINQLFYTLTKAERHFPFRKIIGSSLFVVIARGK